MVRETRFTWDDTDDIEIPQPRDRLDDLDDLLDVFADDRAGAPKPKKPAGNRRGDGRSKPNTDPRRHLADADWLRDERPRERPGS